MPCFNYTFIDVQKIYQDIEGLKDQLSLEKMLATFEIDASDLVQHKSDDDAHITMLVTEALCRKTGKTLDTLVKESQRAICLSKTYMPKKKKQKTAEKAEKSEVKQPNTQKPTQKKVSAKKPAEKTTSSKPKKAYKPRTRKPNKQNKDN